jgi:hypothetical protein
VTKFKNQKYKLHQKFGTIFTAKFMSDMAKGKLVCFIVTNGIAYYKKYQIVQKSFIMVTKGACTIKHYGFVIYRHWMDFEVR